VGYGAREQYSHHEYDWQENKPNILNRKAVLHVDLLETAVSVASEIRKFQRDNLLRVWCHGRSTDRQLAGACRRAEVA
jgi:hypothetical protein